MLRNNDYRIRITVDNFIDVKFLLVFTQIYTVEMLTMLLSMAVEMLIAASGRGSPLKHREVKRGSFQLIVLPPLV